MGTNQTLPMRGTLVSVAPPAPLAGVTPARPLTTSDVTALGRLMAEAYRGTLDDHGESAQLHEAEARATLAGHYGRPICAACFVVPAPEDLLATSIVTLDRGNLLLAFLLVRPDHQARGIGTHLLGLSAHALASVGHSEWTLAVTRGNPAQRLYERSGFRVDESLR